MVVALGIGGGQAPESPVRRQALDLDNGQRSHPSGSFDGASSSENTGARLLIARLMYHAHRNILFMYQGGEDRVTGGQFVLQARRRAGLTQRELARRAGLSQPQVARIESGVASPTFRRVVDLVRACDLDLVASIKLADDSDWHIALGNLGLDVDARVRQHQAALHFARAGCAALEQARAGT